MSTTDSCIKYTLFIFNFFFVVSIFMLTQFCVKATQLLLDYLFFLEYGKNCHILEIHFIIRSKLKHVKYLQSAFNSSKIAIPKYWRNFVFQITGIIILSVGVTVQGIYNGYNEFLSSQFLTLPVFLIVIGSIIFLVTFFGCFGAWKSNYCMILTVRNQSSLTKYFTIKKMHFSVLRIADNNFCIGTRSRHNRLCSQKFHECLDHWHSPAHSEGICESRKTSHYKCMGRIAIAFWMLRLKKFRRLGRTTFLCRKFSTFTFLIT